MPLEVLAKLLTPNVAPNAASLTTAGVNGAYVVPAPVPDTSIPIQLYVPIRCSRPYSSALMYVSVSVLGKLLRYHDHDPAEALYIVPLLTLVS